jgi:TPR repeat protein
MSLFAALPVAAGDYARGYLAYNRGEYAVALKEFRPLADQGQGSAQYFLGQMYAHGRGVKQDYARAAKLFQAAAVQGVAYAQIDLGIMYRRGRGVPQDNIMAHMFYSLAARRGVRRAKRYLRRISSIMSDAERREARQRARLWRIKNRK